MNLRLVVWGLAVGAAAVTFTAQAAVMQPAPDSTVLPQPVPADEKQVVVARGFPATALDLATVFTMRSEAINTTADATAAPGTFFPRCPGALSVEFVLNGGGCSMPLAWYNVTAAGPPALSALHVVVPADARQQMSCSIYDFCPLAAVPMGVTTWTPKVFTTDVCGDPAYAGGAIGFALIGSSTSSYCPATKYSEPRYNVICSVCTAPEPWVTTLIYHSTVDPEAYYLAFEDLPMSSNNWKRATATSTIGADGDFNDFVFAVHGMCSGQACPPATGGRSGTGGNPGAGGMGAMVDTGGSSGTGETGGGVASSGGGGSGGETSGSTGGSAAGGLPGSGGAGAPATGGEGAGGMTTDDGGVGMPCVPGRSLSCSCANGRAGVQVCSDDGQRFGACQCAAGDKPSGCGCGVSPSAGGGGEGGGGRLAALAAALLAALVLRTTARGRRQRHVATASARPRSPVRV